MARFENGWIKIHRSILESVIAKEGNFSLGLFVRLLCMANWKESKVIFNGSTAAVDPGQIVTGLRELSPNKKEDDYLHRTRNALAKMQKCASIEQATGNQGRIITICNWDKYQASEDTDSKQREIEAQTERKRSANEAQLIEEGKKERSINRRKEYSPGFEEIYLAYPRKEGKAAAYKIYNREIKTKEDRDRLIKAVANFSAQMKREQREQKHIKQFSTFMGCWTDYVEQPQSKAQIVMGF